MNRRDFLKYQLTGALWLTAGASGLIRPSLASAAALPDLTVATGRPGPATRAAVELLGGMGQFVKKGDRVLIKPNMSFATPPERASNTHPEVVAALAAMCREAGASTVLILDNPLARAESCLTNSGIPDACAQIQDDMVHMVTDDSLYQETDLPQGVKLTRADIMKAALKSDVLIAAPQAKSHSWAGVSLSLKGMMGLIYNRSVLHRLGLQTAIVDLATRLKADLTVVDATRVLTTNGPSGPGKVIEPNQVIASRDMVAADAYTVASFEWYGQMYQPRQVPHIREAHERGLGRMDLENLAIRTVSV